MMVDEADIDLVGGGNSTQSGSRGIKRPAESPSPSPSRPSKRKVGPLSRDICIRRPFSPASSPPLSQSPPPHSPIVGESQTRPDSPLPESNSPVIFHSTVIIQDEEEHRPLVIAEYDSAIPNELSPQVNGRTESSLHEQYPIPFDNGLSIASDFDSNRTSPEESLSAISLLTSRLVNGDSRGKKYILVLHFLSILSFNVTFRWIFC